MGAPIVRFISRLGNMMFEMLPDQNVWVVNGFS